MQQRNRFTPVQIAPALDPADLSRRYRSVRERTVALIEGLTPEDCVVQSMPDASPAKWHLAHTTWFFETFLLADAPSHIPFDADFGYLFNSYYNAIGERHPRPHRGLLTRPSLQRVLDYRAHVDAAVLAELETGDVDANLVELGLNHEQQHQELLVTDAKHLLSCNPLRPAWRLPRELQVRSAARSGWFHHAGGIVEAGHSGDGFAFDNESPSHKVLLEPFSIARLPVLQGEFAAFVEAGGYRDARLWLSLGWDACKREGWQAPLYWERRDGQWWRFTISGMQPLSPDAPATHLSFFEADAYARWAGARLPTEFEWEAVARSRVPEGNFAEAGTLEPVPAIDVPGHAPLQMFGDAWEWTSSAYAPYPRYRAAAGAIGEYNGKFMCNQYVLRGGSCATPGGHVRATYRNFFPPEARWQFSGLRLARDG